MRVLIVLLFLLLPGDWVRAQSTPADSVRVLTEIETRDGSRYLGDIRSESDTEVVLVTTSGIEIRIATDQIVRRRTVSGRLKDGEFRSFDPNQTRLLFAPTARSLDKGKGYLSAYYVFFGFAAVGLTDRFTLGGGTWLAPQLVGDLVYVAPKLLIHERGNTAFGVGALAGVADGETAGVMYGVFTRGHSDRAVTVGLGFGFADGNVGADPVLVLGGEQRISRRVKLVGEAYAVPTSGEATAVWLGGFRFFGSGLAADLALVGVAGEDGFPAIPWLSFAYNFGD